MGGRGRRGFNAPAGKGGTWMEVTRDRIQSKGTPDQGKGKGSKPQQVRQSVAARAAALAGTSDALERRGLWADEEQFQGHLTGEPVAPVTMQAAHRAALDHHRMVTGRRASGFDPMHNTFYICGRPVQVFIRSKQDYGLVFQVICSLAIPLETNGFFKRSSSNWLSMNC